MSATDSPALSGSLSDTLPAPLARAAAVGGDGSGLPPRPIRFVHRGRVVEVNAAQPTRTVLEWLREDARCTGTKEGCNEGDCGACTVVIGELAEAGAADAVGGLTLVPANACIRFLPTLHGKALFTVEDLKPIANGALHPVGTDELHPVRTDKLHPVQQAMVECHGSQCGFCTPGFVMSLWSVYEHHAAAPTRQQLADALAGNLCRCTGYRTILDAGERMFDLPPARLDTAAAVQALTRLANEDRAENAAFHAPRTLAELAALRERLPSAQLLAGGTDIGVWANKQFRSLPEIVWLGDVAELRRIEPMADGGLRIGAGVSLEAAYAALAQRMPELTEVWLRFASPPIRHAGTLAGNLANGSPIGDSAPVLMALDARLELRRGVVVREVALDDFYLGYMKNRLEPGEFVQAVVVPGAPLQRTLRAYKISKRFDSDISAACAGLAIELDDDVVRTVRIAFGGMAAVVKRAAAAEAAVLGLPWTQATVQAAQAALGTDFTPLSDMRASAGYRLQVARNLLQRFWLETRTEATMDSGATRVWSRP
ncbi:MAG: xanthine dehydrogenase small subunit [Burkholderiaceae bacterium]